MESGDRKRQIDRSGKHGGGGTAQNPEHEAGQGLAILVAEQCYRRGHRNQQQRRYGGGFPTGLQIRVSDRFLSFRGGAEQLEQTGLGSVAQVVPKTVCQQQKTHHEYDHGEPRNRPADRFGAEQRQQQQDETGNENPHAIFL